MQAVQSKLEKLRELVARDPDKTEELRKAVDELNHVRITMHTLHSDNG